MNPQQYIQYQLEQLNQPLNLKVPQDQESLINEIIRLTLSKKFRKYSLAVDPLEHIKESVKFNVINNEPIKFVLPFGAYKLWRLDVTPEADWAELFTFIYFVKWLKPICEIYEPGVWFDFYSDDVIVPRMNNIPEQDLVDYKNTFEEVLNFIESYLPENMKMTLSRVIDQYNNKKEFELEYSELYKTLTESLEGGLPVLDDETKAMVELNVKATQEQKTDPKWRENVMLIHNAYAGVSKRRPYYRPIEQHKIMVVCTPLWGMLCVGSTKDSIAKFWAGAGALKQKNDTYRQVILSPNQIQNKNFKFEPIDLGLKGKNFNKIRIFE